MTEWASPRVWLPPLMAFGLLACGWQLYATHNPHVLPTLSQLVAQVGDHPGLFWQNLLVTLQEAVVGAACGMLAAFVLAIVMCQVRLVERALMPLAVMLNVTPIIAIAPGLVVAFGFGMTPKYIVTAVIVFFPFLINSLIGLRSADPQAHDVLRTLHASRTEILLRLRLPGSLPWLFAAARICMPLSLIGAVVAEFTAPGKASGLGSLIQTAASLSDLKTVYASVVVLAFVGIALTLVVVVLQHRVLAWQRLGTNLR
ncbi:MAG TPA: ABC transporter permease [Acidimicrobiales bacterium]|nr:ABC transporter permease [Acidimicrobiales bacterium]